MSTVRGACPSIDKPMLTGDGILIRLTPLAGFFTPAELSKVAMAAIECGNGVMEVSSRGNLQVRGLTEESLPTFMSRIEDADLALNRDIPVVINPLAGNNPGEITDPRALQARLRKCLKETDLFKRLSPKTSIIIDSSRSLNLAQLIADIRLRAVRTEIGAKWQIFTGGIEARSHMLGVARDDDAALAVVMALLMRISKRGSAARGRDLNSQDFACIAPFIDQDGPGSIDSRPRAPTTRKRAAIGVVALTSGAYAAILAPAYGTITAGHVMRLAKAAEKAGAGKIEPASSKRIIVSEMEKKAADDFSKFAQSDGFITAPDDPRLAIITCAGAPACNSGYIETHKLADEIAFEFAQKLQKIQKLKGEICIHISACDKRCARPGRDAIEILGGEFGCGISIDVVGEAMASITKAHEQLMPTLEQFIKKPNI